MLILTWLDSNHGQPIQKWSFQQDCIRIGRVTSSDVVFTQFLEVSREHLIIHQTDHGWQLLSQGTNGTFVNGNLITETLLKDQDLIRLATNGPLLQVSVLPQEVCNHRGNASDGVFCIHCGEPVVTHQEFVRYYQILRPVGQGGMGTTYLAWDKGGNTLKPPGLLVLKEMNADMVAIPKARELFEREARILQSLSHPGIPKYYDFFVEQGKKYLAMELIHGRNLESLVLEQGPVSVAQAVRWMMEICQILSYLHHLHPPLVHRDIKPANLMIRNVLNTIVLLDFGAVKEVGTRSGTRIGAQGYSAPEQNLGNPCPQSDLYSIVPSLIFLVTGESPLTFYLPYSRDSQFDLSNIAAIPPGLKNVLARASSLKLKNRYQTAEDLAQDLATY